MNGRRVWKVIREMEVWPVIQRRDLWSVLSDGLEVRYGKTMIGFRECDHGGGYVVSFEGGMEDYCDLLVGK
jgi:hypothetical protein